MGSEQILRPNPAVPAPGNALIVPTVTIFDGTENLRILSASSVACVLSIYIRLRRSDGSIEPMTLIHTPTADRVVHTQDFPVGSGTLLNLVIVPTTGNPLIGECFVQAMIIRGFSGATLPMAVLAQDYTSARQPVAWPGGTLRRSTEGNGVLRSLGAHSQTGGPVQVTVPAGARWKVNTIATRLNTIPDGLIGNRFAYLLYTDGTTSQLRYFIISTISQPVGVTWNYFYIDGIAIIDQTANSVMQLPAPAGIILKASDVIQAGWGGVSEGLETISIDAQVEEWLEVA